MAAVAHPLSPISAPALDEAKLLSPPKVRQPYTPPPKKDEEDEDTESDSRPLSRVDDDMNGDVEVDMKSVHLNAAQPPARRKRKKRGSNIGGQSLAGMLRKGIVDHQLGLSLNAILLVAMSWCMFPSLRHKLEAGFLLSYKTELKSQHGESLYGQGPRDFWLVVSFVVIFTGVRAFMLDHVLMPLGGLLGIRKQRGRVRFAEQSYLLLYYTIYWTLGMRLFIQDTPLGLSKSGSPIANLLQSIWRDFPKLYVEATMKFYYLSQLAFWIQQIVVIHLEERRHDHYQMLTHHFVTVALMSTSYAYRMWRAGNAILVCMDIVDLVFPLAKILRYLALQAACDACFALFVITWIAARHVAYLGVCWSTYAHWQQYGTYSLRSSNPQNLVSGLQLSSDGGAKLWRNMFQSFLDPSAETIAFNSKIQFTFLGLLLGLQCITLMWLVMIIKVVIRVLRGEGADDSRSDGENEAEEESNELDELEAKDPAQLGVPFTLDEPEQKFIEVEADSTEMYIRRSGSGSKARPKAKGSGGFSSGLHLGDRKDILNRIGCLSEEQLARERQKMGENSSRPGSGGR